MIDRGSLEIARIGRLMNIATHFIPVRRKSKKRDNTKLLAIFSIRYLPIVIFFCFDGQCRQIDLKISN